jgi:hypothetical protein
VAAYNWWVVVPFVHGLLPSVNGFFSDLEATGRPDAWWMADCDTAAGVLMLLAFLLRGASVDGARRTEWRWMLGFAAAGAIGGRFTYACSEGLSASCRSREWHLELPVHHYVHVVAGIAEFLCLTVAVVLAHRRTRGGSSTTATAYRVVSAVVLSAYPFLGFAYLTDRWGTLVEPVYFVSFSAMALAEVFERRTTVPGPTWAERVLARGLDAPVTTPLGTPRSVSALVPATAATDRVDGSAGDVAVSGPAAVRVARADRPDRRADAGPSTSPSR